MTDHQNEIEKIESRLKSLEIRLSLLESALSNADPEKIKLPDEQVKVNEQVPVSDILTGEEKGLESQIGRFGLAWLGNIVLLFGIIFLTQYLMIEGSRLFSIILGYAAAGAIYFIANYLKKSNVHLAFMFNMNAQILFFYITIRLHFFSASPVIQGRAIAVIVLLLLIVVQSYISIRDKSQAFATLSVIFALTTGIVCDSADIILPMLYLTAAGSIYYYYRYNWQPLLIITIILNYILAFIWLLGNPLIGHSMKLLALQGSAIFLFALGACFSVPLLFRNKYKSSDDFLIGVTFVNGILYTFLLIFIVFGFFSKNYVILFSGITVCCLALSIVLHLRFSWNFASAFYALYGFMAMSIAFHGLLGFPRVYLLLSVQSLVVVTMALWFRNRLIVVMNSLLFLSILLIYFLTSKSINEVNFSFALISLISARIINWKKSKLHLETDLMRNFYLIEGFLMVLYALFNAVPKQFITLSWTIAALVYFLLSFILKNVKYRYMALGTMISASLYLFIVDLAKIEILYRVLALLFLAAISIGISIYYSNRIKKSDN